MNTTQAELQMLKSEGQATSGMSEDKSDLREVEDSRAATGHGQADDLVLGITPINERPIDKMAERRLVRKFDLTVMPLFFLFYLVFNISLTVFYLFYATWEIVANVICKKLGPKLWIALQIVAFGLVCMCTAFVQNFAGLVVARVALGVAEGGVLPALALVLSRFYRRSEMVFRVAIVQAVASMAGAFGGLLASGFISIGPLGGILNAAWRNIFLFEGLITMVIGVVAYAFIPESLEQTKWLTQPERELAMLRKHSESANKSGSTDEASAKVAVKRSFRSASNWICCLGYVTGNVPVQGVSLFLPLILQGLYPGLPTVQIQLRTVPPYVVGFVWSLAVAYLSNRLNKRFWVMMMCAPFALAGYVMFVASQQSDLQLRYGAAFLIVLGAFPMAPFFFAWGLNNCATDTERAVASGLIPGVGQLGAIIATWVYLPTDAPNYYKGNKLNIGIVSLLIATSVAMYIYCQYENRLRSQGKRNHRLDGFTEAELQAGVLGYHHPSFRYST